MSFPPFSARSTAARAAAISATAPTEAKVTCKPPKLTANEDYRLCARKPAVYGTNYTASSNQIRSIQLYLSGTAPCIISPIRGKIIYNFRLGKFFKSKIQGILINTLPFSSKAFSRTGSGGCTP